MQAATTGDMNFLDRAGRQTGHKCVGVDPVIAAIEIKVLDIEKDFRAGFPANETEKLRIRQLRVRPFEQIGDILQQKWNRDTGLHGPYFGNNGLRDCGGPWQWQQIAKVSARRARERQV